LYRAALALRRARDLGDGALVWVDEFRAEPSVLAFCTDELLVLTNLGETPVPLPAGFEVVLASASLDEGRVPADTTVWPLPTLREARPGTRSGGERGGGATGHRPPLRRPGARVRPRHARTRCGSSCASGQPVRPSAWTATNPSAG